MDNVCIQQRLRDLENRIRKWHFLKIGIVGSHLRTRRSTSADQRHKVIECTSSSPSPQHHRPNNIGYLTSPMERKFTPLTMKPSPSRRDAEKETLEFEYHETFKNSGTLEIDGSIQKIQHDEFNVIEVLGSGSCGIVEKVIIRNHTFAVKTMYKNDNKENIKRILRDVRIMSICKSPYIVKSFGYFMFDSSVKICMEIMATCCEKLLRRIYHAQLAFFPEFVASRTVYSTINALLYLKDKHSIIHRDIKPSNILMNFDGSIKLCDFGISGYLVNSRANSNNSGCPPYMAPERLTFETSCTYDVRSDVWSLGVTVYQLVTGRYPFPLDDLEFTTLTIIADLSLPPPSLRNEENCVFSHSLTDFVDKCLIKDVRHRPNYEQLLKHSFVRNSNLEPGFGNEKESASMKPISEWLNKMMAATTICDETRPIPNTPCVN